MPTAPKQFGELAEWEMRDLGKHKLRKREFYFNVVRPRRVKWLEDNGPCVDCGSWIDLEADHVDPKEKISHRVWSWSDSRREMELSKCVPRCRSCHLKKTMRDNRWGGHGTEAHYSWYGCRCGACRTAHATYRRERRAVMDRSRA